MDNRHYVRKRAIHNRRTREKENGHFFIRANICLGVVICVLAGVKIENDVIQRGCDGLRGLIATTTTPEEAEQLIESVINGGDIYTIAGEKHKIRLSDDIKQEIEQRSDIYGQKNKGAPQTTVAP